MATITKWKNANGTMSYRALIRVKREGKIIASESRTFPRRAMAENWSRKRETEIKGEGSTRKLALKDITVGDVIHRYRAEYEQLSGWARSKREHLRFLAKHDIGRVKVQDLTSQVLIDHVRTRRQAGTGPSTVMNDITWLKAAFSPMNVAWDLPFDMTVFEDALQFSRDQKLVRRSRRRTRRPTKDELSRLDKYFAQSDQNAMIPMQECVKFALESSRRQAEITRLRWDDLIEKDLVIVVRDVKHPRTKKGNDLESKLTPEALEIIKRQPRTSELIFPYNPKSVGARFTRACRILGIQDLRFHDLRHEATSRLFERGYAIHEVAAFTLHLDWNNLRSYKHLKAKDVPTRPYQAA